MKNNFKTILLFTVLAFALACSQCGMDNKTTTTNNGAPDSVINDTIDVNGLIVQNTTVDAVGLEVIECDVIPQEGSANCAVLNAPAGADTLSSRNFQFCFQVTNTNGRDVKIDSIKVRIMAPGFTSTCPTAEVTDKIIGQNSTAIFQYPYCFQADKSIGTGLFVNVYLYAASDAGAPTIFKLTTCPPPAAQ